jgi:hypothetical protein
MRPIQRAASNLINRRGRTCFLQTAPARELNDNNMFCGLVCVVKWQVNFRVGRFINHFGAVCFGGGLIDKLLVWQ